MSDNPGYGFVPSPNSPKKELTETPTANPPVVNNYFTIALNTEAFLFLVLLVILVIGITRLGPMVLKA